MNSRRPTVVTYPNTDEGVRDFLLALSLIMTMDNGYNREVKPSHAKLMAQSIREYGITRAIIAINTNCFNGKQNTYSGDGQHLIEAILKYLKPSEIQGILSIAYYDMTDRSEIIPFISRLNSTAKSWSILEFLTSWATHGVETYTFLLDIHNKTKHSISKLIEIYTFKRDAQSSKAFRLGELKINKTLGNYVLATYQNAIAIGLHKSNKSFLAFTRIMVDYQIKDPTEILHIINEDRKSKVQSFGMALTRDEYLTLFRTALGRGHESVKGKSKKTQKKLVGVV